MYFHWNCVHINKDFCSFVNVDNLEVLYKGLPTRCKICSTVAMDTTPNDVWNILRHLARKILHARLCLHVARRQSIKMPSYIVENICCYRPSQYYLQVIYTACHCD